MEKKIIYKGKEYSMVVKWSGSSYCIMIIGLPAGFVSIPNDCINDIEKIKPYIIQAFEKKGDLHALKEWDGILQENLELKKYDIWQEGFRESEIQWQAVFLGTREAISFEQACAFYMIQYKYDNKLYNPDNNSYNGRRFFDNEADARKSFG